MKTMYEVSIYCSRTDDNFYKFSDTDHLAEDGKVSKNNRISLRFGCYIFTAYVGICI
jgi:hypothetical protein